MGIAVILSSFMNNIGAMAMLLPVTLGICQKMGWSPSKFLMPLAFASILGGMNTKIGTPPNIIISEFRDQYSDQGFEFFDFAYAGLPVSIGGVIFIALLGFILVKNRSGDSDSSSLVEINEYLVELVIDKDSDLIGRKTQEFRKELGSDVVLIGSVNESSDAREILSNFEVLKESQILLLKINPEEVSGLQDKYGLSLRTEIKDLDSGSFGEIETMISPGSRLIGRTISYFSNMVGRQMAVLGLWRKGTNFQGSLSNEHFKAGDVLLIATREEQRDTSEKMQDLGLMPLWQRELDVIKDDSKVLLSLGLFSFSLLLVITNFLNVVIAFLLCVLAFVASKLLKPNMLYRHIEWPVIVLLGAMIPIGDALYDSGLTNILATVIATQSIQFGLVGTLVILMVATMCLSDVINNAATAVIMGPISVTIANQLGHPSEPFLMCVAIGASCAFLSPIGHQCNTLVMGPGNYKFGDYWKLGLPLELLIIAISTPLLLIFWF
jgi:di/tricarboxylate transporter